MKKNRAGRMIKLTYQREWLAFYLVGYAGFFTVGQIFYGNLIFSSIFGLIIILLSERHKRFLEQKRKNQMRQQFSDLLHSLAASVATGRQLPTAIQEAHENLGFIYHENTPMMVELKLMTKSFAENRDSEEHILSAFADRSKVEEIENFVEVCLTCRVTGGDLHQVIMNASYILMEKISIEREIRVMISQKKFEGKIISIMPILVISSLNLTSPGYLDNLYHTLAGRMVMTVALLGMFAAYVLTEKITNIEG
jgi:tight adherence protein B